MEKRPSIIQRLDALEERVTRLENREKKEVTTTQETVPQQSSRLGDYPYKAHELKNFPNIRIYYRSNSAVHASVGNELGGILTNTCRRNQTSREYDIVLYFMTTARIEGSLMPEASLLRSAAVKLLIFLFPKNTAPLTSQTSRRKAFPMFDHVSFFTLKDNLRSVHLGYSSDELEEFCKMIQ